MNRWLVTTHSDWDAKKVRYQQNGSSWKRWVEGKDDFGNLFFTYVRDEHSHGLFAETLLLLELQRCGTPARDERITITRCGENWEPLEELS